jgi:hypothetical protein
MREEFVKRMRCLADAIPKTARPETMLMTASVTMSCIIEKPLCAGCFFLRVVRVVAVITPPVRNPGGFGKTFPRSRVQRLCQRRITSNCCGFSRAFVSGDGLVVTKGNEGEKRIT